MRHTAGGFYQRVWNLAVTIVTGDWCYIHDYELCGWFDHLGRPVADVGIRCKSCGKAKP